MVATARRTATNLCQSFVPYRRCEPFRDAEEAWLWTMAALIARPKAPAIPRTRAKLCGHASRMMW